jgi:hypothetical protein
VILTGAGGEFITGVDWSSWSQVHDEGVDDFRVVHANLTGGNRVTTGGQVPHGLFTNPELARIGLNETEAEAQGIAYRLFKVRMETNLRARTLSETRGFVKILGFTAFGVGAGEVLAEGLMPLFSSAASVHTVVKTPQSVDVVASHRSRDLTTCFSFTATAVDSCHVGRCWFSRSRHLRVRAGPPI